MSEPPPPVKQRPRVLLMEERHWQEILDWAAEPEAPSPGRYSKTVYEISSEVRGGMVYAPVHVKFYVDGKPLPVVCSSVTLKDAP